MNTRLSRLVNIKISPAINAQLKGRPDRSSFIRYAIDHGIRARITAHRRNHGDAVSYEQCSFYCSDRLYERLKRAARKGSLASFVERSIEKALSRP